MTGAIYWRCESCRERRRVPGKRKACQCGTVRPRLPLWIIRWYEHGKPHVEFFGRYKSSLPAQRRLAAIQEAIAEERVVRPNLDARVTLRQLVEWFLVHPDVSHLASAGDIRIKLAHVCAIMGENLRICDLTAEVLNRFKTLSPTEHRRTGFTAQPATINKELTYLRAMVYRAVKEGRIEGRNLPPFEALPVDSARRRVLSAEEALTLYRLLPSPADTQAADSVLAAMFILARYTGMRREEIVALRRSEVSLAEKVIRLELGRTKEHAPKTIPLVIQARNGHIIDHALWAISCQPVALHDDRVFHRGPRTARQLSKQFLRVCRQAGLAPIRFHDLRRTFIVWMVLSMGFAERTVMAITGHRTRKAFDAYRADIEREAVSVMGDQSPLEDAWGFDPVVQAYRGDQKMREA